MEPTPAPGTSKPKKTVTLAATEGHSESSIHGRYSIYSNYSGYSGQSSDDSFTLNFSIRNERKKYIRHPASDLETFMNLLKGLIGAGMLGMPYAYSCAGFTGALLGTLLVGTLTPYAMYMLLKASSTLYYRHSVPFLSYGEALELGVMNGPEKFRKYAKASHVVAEVLLCVALLGICIVYTVIIGRNVMQIVVYFNPETVNYMSVRYYILITIPLIVGMSMINFLHYLAYFSMAANVALLLAVALTIYYCVTPPVEAISELKQFGSLREFLIFYDILIFSMEAIGVLMSVENSMLDPKHMLGVPGIFCGAITCGVLLYAIVGFFGFVKYGEQTMGSITLNLPIDEPFPVVIKLTVTLAILVSFALQFFVPMEIFITRIERRMNRELPTKYVYLFRGLSSVAVSLMGIAVPNIEGITSLVGACSLSVLGIIIPAILDLIVYYDTPDFYHMRRISDAIIIVFGVSCMVAGIVASILQIASHNEEAG